MHRLTVLGHDGRVLGILEALDLFSYLSNHSHLITMQVEQAQDLDALARAAAQIAQLVQQLNARLFERAWQMIAPPEVVANTCLFVMGSEGRGEQLLKTDQDNGLLLRNPDSGWTPPADLPALCERFADALARFGYPPCPGGIMLRNPDWRGTVADWAQHVRGWRSFWTRILWPAMPRCWLRCARSTRRWP